MATDPLSNAMIAIKNSELNGKSECIVAPASNLIKEVLQVMQANSYIGNFEFIDDGKSGKFKIKLLGKINNCRAIRPRYPVKLTEIEAFERQYLPAREFGVIILSTPYGVISHKAAREKNTGGVLLSFVY